MPVRTLELQRLGPREEIAEDLEAGAIEVRHPELMPQRRGGPNPRDPRRSVLVPRRTWRTLFCWRRVVCTEGSVYFDTQLFAPAVHLEGAVEKSPGRNRGAFDDCYTHAW